MTHTLSPGSLASLKVIDASRVLGGPYAGQILADHGADVIKVEPPQGDETRGWGPPFLDDTASYFLGLNRNKRGMALDMSQPAGLELLLRLPATKYSNNYKTLQAALRAAFCVPNSRSTIGQQNEANCAGFQHVSSQTRSRPRQNGAKQSSTRISQVYLLPDQIGCQMTVNRSRIEAARALWAGSHLKRGLPATIR